MDQPYTSRELAQRVEIDVQKRPNRFYRRTWWWSLWLSLFCLLWLWFEGARGNLAVYEGGDLATPHRIFENDCAKCHSEWTTLDRVVNFDFSSHVYSVDNNDCLACHPGTEHHKNQFPANNDISCAYCHVDHVGDVDLKRSPDRVCTECHSALVVFGEDDKSPRPSETFATAVTDFGSPGGHPPFAFEKLIASGSAETGEVNDQHKVYDLLSYVDGVGWGDKAQISFNHSAHLKSERDANGNLVYGIIDFGDRDKQQRFTDLSEACNVCHRMDAEGRYMLPMTYEQNCQSCHPLYYDNERFPNDVVPHEVPETVRGYLHNKYTQLAREQPARLSDAPRRAIPGRKNQQKKRSGDQSQWLAEQIMNAEKVALSHERVFFGSEARGGCTYCHAIKNEDSPSDWSIVPPRIPSRWQPHAVFSHRSHQVLNCAECHTGVFESSLTSDVILPGIELCRECHSPNPIQPTPALGTRFMGARSDCVECHIYHDHSQDEFIGTLNPQLAPSKANPNAGLSGKNSN